jgi:hypothetical protein
MLVENRSQSTYSQADRKKTTSVIDLDMSMASVARGRAYKQNASYSVAQPQQDRRRSTAETPNTRSMMGSHAGQGVPQNKSSKPKLDHERSTSETPYSRSNSQPKPNSSILPHLAPIPKSKSAIVAVEKRSFGTETNPYVRAHSDDSTFLKSYIPSSPARDGINSQSSFTDNSLSLPNATATDLSPAKVNLNARHFCGKRRDRMRPMQRRESIAWTQDFVEGHNRYDRT